MACLTVRSFSLDGAWYNLQPGRSGPSPWLAGLDFDACGSVSALAAAFGAESSPPTTGTSGRGTCRRRTAWDWPSFPGR